MPLLNRDYIPEDNIAKINKIIEKIYTQFNIDEIIQQYVNEIIENNRKHIIFKHPKYGACIAIGIALMQFELTNKYPMIEIAKFVKVDLKTVVYGIIEVLEAKQILNPLLGLIRNENEFREGLTSLLNEINGIFV